jgi:hypothetical protein
MNSHLKNRQRPTSNKPDPDTNHDHDTPDTEFCTKCDKLTDHKQADCPNKYSDKPTANVVEHLSEHSDYQSEHGADWKELGLDGWEHDDYDDFENNLERVACVTLPECTTFSSIML